VLASKQYEVYECDPPGSGNLLLVSGDRVINGAYTLIVEEGAATIPFSRVTARSVGCVLDVVGDVDYNRLLAQFRSETKL
jgi:hypothetical protein